MAFFTIDRRGPTGHVPDVRVRVLRAHGKRPLNDWLPACLGPVVTLEAPEGATEILWRPSTAPHGSLWRSAPLNGYAPAPAARAHRTWRLNRLARTMALA